MLEMKQETFDTLCSWIELSDDELYTINDLQVKLQNIAHGDETLAYSKQQIKRKLIDKYGDHLFFAEIAGKSNVICFRNMASCIINEQWYNKKQTSIEDESVRVITAAAKLIRSEIREMTCDMMSYLTPSDFSEVDSC